MVCDGMRWYAKEEGVAVLSGGCAVAAAELRCSLCASLPLSSVSRSLLPSSSPRALRSSSSIRSPSPRHCNRLSLSLSLSLSLTLHIPASAQMCFGLLCLNDLLLCLAMGVYGHHERRLAEAEEQREAERTLRRRLRLQRHMASGGAIAPATSGSAPPAPHSAPSSTTLSLDEPDDDDDDDDADAEATADTTQRANAMADAMIELTELPLPPMRTGASGTPRGPRARSIHGSTIASGNSAPFSDEAELDGDDELVLLDAMAQPALTGAPSALTSEQPTTTAAATTATTTTPFVLVDEVVDDATNLV